MHEVISLGAGVQSSVMALMAARGELAPMPELAIFADTQYEPPAVYEHLAWLKTQLPFPVQRVTAGDIRADQVAGRNTRGQQFRTMPLFTETGPGRRQCTNNYKIEPIRLALRTLLGLRPRQRTPKVPVIRQWIGISRDEATRMKPARDHWIENIWPLVEAGLSRRECQAWFADRYPKRHLPRSACIACPYHTDREWRTMQRDDPAAFADAVAFDAAMRTEGQQEYVHRTCLPLASVDFRNLEDLGQQNFFENECEGMCGV